MKKIIKLSIIMVIVLPFIANSQTNPVANTFEVIDDFESAEKTYKKWSNPMESGTMKSSIDLSDSAQSGKKGAKISFIGTKSKGSWTNLQCKTTISPKKNKITFWAKAEKECTVKITLHQAGATHTEMEIFGKNIAIDEVWKKYEVSISEFTEVVFSHPQQDGGKASEKAVNEKVTAVGFAETNLSASFYIDNLSLE